MKTGMTRPKTNTEAAQDAVTAKVEGATAAATAPEAAVPGAEDISAPSNPVPDLFNPETDDLPPGPDTGTGITVVIAAKQPIRWRIGRQFTPEPALIALDDLSEADVAALRSDPLLLVTAIKDI